MDILDSWKTTNLENIEKKLYDCNVQFFREKKCLFILSILPN